MATSTTPLAPQTTTVRVGPHAVRVDEYGREGPTILLLHGIPGWRGTWGPVAARLAAGHRVVAPDLLGFGESTDPGEDFHARGQAQMVLGLLDALDLGAAHVVGFDFGGPIALTLYRQCPARVLSLCLSATNVFTDTPIPGPLKLANVPGLGALVFRAAFGRLGLSLLWRAAVGDRVTFPRSRYVEMLRWKRGIAWTRRIFLASMRDLPGLYGDVQDTLARIDVPTVVLWGDRDPFFGVAVAERTAAAIPGARLVTFAGCGHFVPEERADRFAVEVANLVGSARPR